MNEDTFVPMLVFALPILAIVGGFTAGILKVLGQQRLVELAQRERLAAIERGIDPEKLPSLSALGGAAGMLWTPRDFGVRRAQNLMITGLICLATGLAMMLFLRIIQTNDEVWAIGILPVFVGLALLVSAWIVHPKS